MWTRMKWSDLTDFWGDKGGPQGTTRSGDDLFITIFIVYNLENKVQKLNNAKEYRVNDPHQLIWFEL